MREVKCRTSKGNFRVQAPECWEDMTVEQYQRLIKEWDGQDWIQAFSIITGIEATTISDSTDVRLGPAILSVIEFIFDPTWDWNKLQIPKGEFTLQSIWEKDSWLVPPCCQMPKSVGKMTIGQTIQARQSIAGVKDYRECLSIVTAIYLQPLFDKRKDVPGSGKFNMLRVIEIERLILKSRITTIYPIGFFLLRRLTHSGGMWQKFLNLLAKLNPRRKGSWFQSWRKAIYSTGTQT
jgi:hypothetical protein